MGGKKNCFAPFFLQTDELDELFLHLGVETARRLVHDDDVGVVHEGADNRHFSFHA